ncbi:MAG: formate/nitrite transporter family protein [Gammaproteobacteria bacterium]|jgi:formate/nitrite transporter FocA (FNT family)
MPKNRDNSQLSAQEARDAVRRSAPRAAVVFEAIRLEAVEELERENPALFWSGIAAGLSMGFSFIAEALLQSTLPEAPWRPLLTKLGYSVGFMIVILGRQQLFTENTLTPVIHVLREGRMAVLLDALRLWGVVLLANILATLLFATGLYAADVFDPIQTSALKAVALESVDDGFRETFLSAILAGWLIALMVWLLPVAETARVAVIVIITYLVGLGGFSHIIAGSTLAFYALAAGLTTPWTVLSVFFLPTLIGNIIGGVAFVALLNYAQVAHHD